MPEREVPVAATGQYDRSYYDGFDRSGRASADVICPLLLERWSPESVIDVGCGNGYFLDAFAALGVGERLGIDGPFNDGSAVRAGGHEFQVVDLQREALAPDERYDLAICLEVAEHLPVADGPRLVEGLTRAGRTVAFSAAAPHQPGEGHVTCRWPSYWAELFERHGYHATDDLRPVLRGDDRVSWWYQQNVIVFSPDVVPPARHRSLDVAHPELLAHVRRQTASVSGAGAALTAALRQKVRRQLR